MKRFAALISLFLSVGLVACGSHEEPKQPDPPPVKDTVFGDMVSAEDKARAVQDTVTKQKEETDRQLEQQEGGQSQDQ